jgi:hypothetical protein
MMMEQKSIRTWCQNQAFVYSVKKMTTPREEILCILTRADQQDEAEFKCFAYAPREK